MRKSVLAILMMATVYAVAIAGYPEGYYSRMDGKRKENLKAAAKQCVQSHTRLGYYDLPDYWAYSDVYPERVDGMKRWWEMYSDALYLIRDNQTGKQSFSANKMQREHSVPKSWWKKGGDVEYTPAYSDMWNLYPSDAAANQAKLNYPFGETRAAIFDNGVTKVGAPKAGYGGGSPNVFEPADEYKGDFARALFYMATVYDDLPWVYSYMFVTNSYPTLLPWASNMLLQWARQDPVSQKEIDRNDYVEQFQGNRNPFIDFPQLAEYIWGVRASETFVISEQENTGDTPPITGNPEITAPVNGETLDFGEIAEGVRINRALQIKGRNMTSALSVRVAGAGRELFRPEVSSIPATTMNSNGGYLLNISYEPVSKGEHEAILTLYDGGIEGSIAVTLRGRAAERPDLRALTALPATDVTANSYVANWSAPAGVADYYTLTRVRYLPEGEEAQTYETGETSYELTDRDPSVAESYTVTYSRLGMESPVSNSVYVAATGIADLREDAPYHVYVIDGGLCVSRADDEGGELRVFDIYGREIVRLASPADGLRISLDPGIYIMTVGHSRPVSVCVR